MNMFPESRLAHEYLDGLNGCEIGASPENPFNIQGGAYCNIDIPATDRISHNAYYHNDFAVNIFADGAHLPFKDNCMDYVLSSHVIEHFFDTIGAISEWLRVIRPGGYVFMIIPHKDRIYDINRPVTTVAELLARHSGKLTRENYIVRKNPGYELGTDINAVYASADFIKISDEIPDGYMRLECLFRQEFHNVFRPFDYAQVAAVEIIVKTEVGCFRQPVYPVEVEVEKGFPFSCAVFIDNCECWGAYGIADT